MLENLNPQFQHDHIQQSINGKHPKWASPLKVLFCKYLGMFLKDFGLKVIFRFRMKFGVEQAIICPDCPRG